MARLDISQPAVYEIRVSGHLNASWATRLNDMQIVLKDNETWLTGRLVDQAALFGVLTALYDWGYALILVQRIGDPGQAHRLQSS